MDEQIQTALQGSMLQLMLQGLMKGCFEICITRPGKELSSNEKQCLAMCQDRYMEGFQKTFFNQYSKIIKELQDSQMGNQFAMD